MKKILIIVGIIAVLIVIVVLASGSSDVQESFNKGMEQGKQTVEGK